MSDGQLAAETKPGSLVARAIALVLAAGVMLLLIGWASGQEAAPEPGVDPATAEPAVAEDPGPVAIAELASGTITGTVTDVDGTTPRAGLSVTLVSLDDGSVVSGALTGADGTYVLEGVPVGIYLVHVSTPGLTAVVETTEKAKAQTLNVVMPTLLMAPAPAGTPEALQPQPAEGVALTEKDTVTLLAAPLTYPEELAATAEPAGGQGGDNPGQGGGPPPGKGRPPVPPGRPPDKPLPPPFVSPDEP